MGLSSRCEISSVGYDKFRTFLNVAPAYIQCSGCVLSGSQRGELLQLFRWANETLRSNIWSTVLDGQSPEEFYYNALSFADQYFTLQEFYIGSTEGYNATPFQNLTPDVQRGIGSIIFFIVLTFGAQKLQSTLNGQIFINKVLRFIFRKTIGSTISGPLDIQRYRAVIEGLSKMRVVGISATIANNHLALISQPTLLETGALIPIVPACIDPCGDNNSGYTANGTGVNTSVNFGKEIVAGYFGTWVPVGAYITKSTNCETGFCVTLKSVTDYNFENRIISSLMGKRESFRYSAFNLNNVESDDDDDCSSSSSCSTCCSEEESCPEQPEMDYAFYGPRAARPNRVNNTCVDVNCSGCNACGGGGFGAFNEFKGTRLNLDDSTDSIYDVVDNDGDDEVDDDEIQISSAMHFVTIEDKNGSEKKDKKEKKKGKEKEVDSYRELDLDFSVDKSKNKSKSKDKDKNINNEKKNKKDVGSSRENEDKGRCRRRNRRHRGRGRWRDNGYIPAQRSVRKLGTVFGYLRQILYEVYKIKCLLRRLRVNRVRAGTAERDILCEQAAFSGQNFNNFFNNM